MGTSALLAILAFSTVGAPIPAVDVQVQNETFKQLWNADFEWKFDALPTEGSVPNYRVPYSGHIYPDTAGGTTNVLYKYDRAFNGRGSAASHERWDTTAFKEPTERRGLFGRTIVSRRERTPDWYGHCNGWTAAAIRHAEPKYSVNRNGVVFTPADIKGLLAELYIYNDHKVLAGEETGLNAGVLHALITNWVGRGKYAMGLESDPSKEKWNYPLYAYACSFGRHSANQVEVKMNVAYAKDSQGEYQESPRIKEVKYFHYMLELDAAGRIMGGYYFRDSAAIDMLWIPLSPKASGQPGNEQGNPYVNVQNVLALWRDSVPAEERKRWMNIDPAAGEPVATLERQAEIIAEEIAAFEAARAAEEANRAAEAEAAENENDSEFELTDSSAGD